MQLKPKQIIKCGDFWILLFFAYRMYQSRLYNGGSMSLGNYFPIKFFLAEVII